MLLGSRLKELREKKGLKQKDLAALLETTTTTLYRWEKGKNTPSDKDKHRLAKILGCSIAYLMGESDEPTAKTNRVTLLEPEDFIKIPLLSMNTAACCGAGNGLYGVDFETSQFVMVSRKSIRAYDDLRKPFAIKTEGDSMEGAGISDGSVAIVNPAEECQSGDVVLVCYNDNWSIKWILCHKNGDVELRAANPNYGPIIVEADIASDTNWFKVVGKVVEIVQTTTPKRML